MAPQGLIDLIESIEGEAPIFFGESFNEHFTTSKSFIKLTRPWVKPFRFEAEVAMAREVAALGVPVAHPAWMLRSLSLTKMERLATSQFGSAPPRWPLTREQGTRIAAEWIKRLWELPVPTAATEFTLADFAHAAHVRLDGNQNPHAQRVLELILEGASIPAIIRQLTTASFTAISTTTTCSSQRTASWSSIGSPRATARLSGMLHRTCATPFRLSSGSSVTGGLLRVLIQSC